MFCSETEQPRPAYADLCTLFKRGPLYHNVALLQIAGVLHSWAEKTTVAGVCPRGLQSSMAAGCPAMGYRTVSPQEGVDGQAKRKGRIRPSVTFSLLF